MSCHHPAAELPDDVHLLWKEFQVMLLDLQLSDGLSTCSLPELLSNAALCQADEVGGVGGRAAEPDWPTLQLAADSGPTKTPGSSAE